MNVSIKPPEIKMTLGETVECTDGDTWLFVGYVQTTISYQLAFLNVSKLSLASPRFYHATHKHTIQNKFPSLKRRDGDVEHRHPDACWNLVQTYDGDCMNCDVIARLHHCSDPTCEQCHPIHRPGEKECPECGIATLRGKGLNEGGGVECRNPDCSYWFCY